MRTEAELASRRPDLLIVDGWDGYRLIDMGAGRKLEQFGPFLVDRPEEQAMAPRLLPIDVWARADAVFDGDAEDGEGRWRFSRHDMPASFPMAWDGIRFHGRFTPFRHLGFFPEQAAHWHWMAERLTRRAQTAPAPPRVLNLFGYTGLASLVAARAGAQVTHIDASRKTMGFARENQILAGMGEAPIRWIVEDAVKFVDREIRRGNRYDGIILDPPKFGRGPNKEVWSLFADLPRHLSDCIALLSEEADFLVLTAYAIRASYLSIEDLLRQAMGARGGRISAGELAIRVDGSDRLLSTSLFARWSRT